MPTLSKAWGWFLLLIQWLNAIAAGLVYLSLVPKIPAPVRDTVLLWNVYIAAGVGSLQAMTKALPDEDHDGTPDIFQSRPPTR